MGMSKAEEDSNPSKGHKQETLYLNDPSPFYLLSKGTADVPKALGEGAAAQYLFHFRDTLTAPHVSHMSRFPKII